MRKKHNRLAPIPEMTFMRWAAVREIFQQIDALPDKDRERLEQELVARRFWSDVRGKLAVARKDVAEGRTVDGESAMNEILAELDVDRPAKRRKPSR
jgi:hypothetical protein